MDNLEGTIFETYDSVYFDLDKTIWECFTPTGTSIGAYELNPPFEMLSGVIVKDVDGNYCRLQEGIRTVLELLDGSDMNMGVVSSGEKDNTPHDAQPSVLLLKKFNLYKYFNLGVICKAYINKKEYVRGFGKTLFIDDDDDKLQQVKTRPDVDVLDRKAFDGWDQILEQKKSNLVFGLTAFLKKKADEEFQYRSGADTLLNIYKAEQIYSHIEHKRSIGEDVSDSENVRWLKVKQQLPSLFEDAVKFLREMLTDTLLWEHGTGNRDNELSDMRRNTETPHTDLINEFTHCLAVLNDASSKIYDERSWPQVFIAIDTVINLIHMDYPYIQHLVWGDQQNMDDELEDYARTHKTPTSDLESISEHYLEKIEEKWEAFTDYLRSAGKGLQFVDSSQKSIILQKISELERVE